MVQWVKSGVLCVGGSTAAVRVLPTPIFSVLGGLARSQISARIGARQSNRRGNLSRGVFPWIKEYYWSLLRDLRG